MRDRVSLDTVSVSLPFGIGSLSWKVNRKQQEAAWSLYVELVTRIAVQSLELEIPNSKLCLPRLLALNLG